MPVPGIRSVEFDIDLKSDDLVIINLETPITHALTPRAKAGPTLNGTIEPLEELASRASVVAVIANNHIMDFGLEGLRQTIEVCELLGIRTVGAGENITAAREPLLIQHNDKMIGVTAFAESQYGMASQGDGGVAPFHPGYAISTTQQLKQDADIVIASMDGGAELSPWPSPGRLDSLRMLAISGADIVHGHHSHVPQGFERVGDEGVVFCGLGNFLVDPADWSSVQNADWSTIVRIELTGDSIEWTVLSTETAIVEEKVVVQQKKAEDALLADSFMARCIQPLQDPLLLEALWQEVSVDLYEGWFREWLGFQSRHSALASNVLTTMKSAVRNVLSRRTGAPVDSNLLRYHLFACESHSEAIATALGVISGELRDVRSAESRQLADSMLPWRQRGGEQMSNENS